MGLLGLLACVNDPTEGTATSEWVTLAADCAPPATLPAAPLTPTGTVSTRDDRMQLSDLALAEDLLYTVGQGGLGVFDVSDPAAPVRIAADAGSFERYHRVVLGDHGRLAVSNRDDGVTLYDISDPATPWTIGHIVADGAEGLAWVDGVLFVAQHGGAITAWNVDAAPEPVSLGAAAGLAATWMLAPGGEGTLYAADSTLGVVPIDIADPTAPRLGSPVPLSPGPRHLAAAPGWLYAATGAGGVVVLDRSDPAAPRVVATLDTGAAVEAVAVDGDLLWVADRGGVALVDIHDPTRPFLLGRAPNAEIPLGVAAAGGQAWLADWTVLAGFRADAAARAGQLELPAAVHLPPGGGEVALALANRGAGDLSLRGAAADGLALAVSAESVPAGGTATLRVSWDGAAALPDALCLATDDPSAPVRSLPVVVGDTPPVGEPAPDFTLYDLDGAPHTLSEAGGPVLLAFFASWCNQCPTEVLDLEQAYGRPYAEAGLHTWLVASRDTREAAADFAETLGLTMPVLLDEDGAVQDNWQVADPTIARFPLHFLVDGDGIIRYYANAYDAAALGDAIADALAAE